MDLVTKAGLEAAEKVPHTLKERNPGVWLVDFGDSSFNFELGVWITHEAVKRPGAVQAVYNREIAAALRKYAIEFPVSQRELRIHSTALRDVFSPPQASRRTSLESLP